MASREALTEKLFRAAGWTQVHRRGGKLGKHLRWHCPCGRHFASSSRSPSTEVLFNVKTDLRRCPQTNREALRG